MRTLIGLALLATAACAAESDTYGIRNAPLNQVYPWGKYDNTAPGYRAHGLYLSHPFWGRTPNAPSVYQVGSRPRRGDNNAVLTYDRHGRPVYTR